eukprot:UN07612
MFWIFFASTFVVSFLNTYYSLCLIRTPSSKSTKQAPKCTFIVTEKHEAFSRKTIIQSSVETYKRKSTNPFQTCKK